MYSLPTFYDNVEVPLPKNMYNLPSYYETKIESMVSRALVASFSLKKEQLLHVGITFLCVFTNQFYYQAFFVVILIGFFKEFAIVGKKARRYVIGTP